jgi:preprotein translocase subunit YajC
MFFTPAYAQSAGDAAGAMGGLAGIIPFILMFVIFYFLLIRPQQKRMKEHKQMVENLRRGDQVITSGGVHGKVTRVGQDDEAELQIAEGVKIRVVKSTIASVVSKTEPANDG